MDTETMPHAMYFMGDSDTVTKINHVPYQTIVQAAFSLFGTAVRGLRVEIFVRVLRSSRVNLNNVNNTNVFGCV